MRGYVYLLSLGAILISTGCARSNRPNPHDLSKYVDENEIGALELAMRDSQNPNDPNEAGHLAIATAVRNKNLEIAEYLLNYMANATLPEPISGSSAIVTAFEIGDSSMARLLMKYGGNPDIPDANGITARSTVTTEVDFLDLLEAYDADGPMAFEDSPGFWKKEYAKEYAGVPYFFSKEADKSQYFVPVSCSWIRVIVDTLPLYVNKITHQSTWKRPNALAWRKLIDQDTGNEYYYNYRTDATISHVPAEVPNDLLTEIQREAGTYWYNHVTGEHSWEDPKESTWIKTKHETGHEYYFHPETQESSWDVPEEHAWIAHMSPEHGRHFYTSKNKKHSQWDKPPALGWIKGNVLNSGKAMSDEF